MGIFSSIFGSKKNSETIVSGAVSGLDKIIFTQEERADANQKLSEWYLKYLEATQPQNLARRLIALIIVSLWALLVVLGVAAYGVEYYFFGIDEPKFSAFIFNVLVDIVMNPFLVVIGFYFLTHTVRAYQKGK